jgi:hypothetical protein
VQLSPAVRDNPTVQVRGVTAKSKLGEPPVRAVRDVSTPLLWAVNVTVTGEEVAPTMLIPENVSGVVEIWAPETGASKHNRANGHRFALSNMVEPPLFVARQRRLLGLAIGMGEAPFIARRNQLRVTY